MLLLLLACRPDPAPADSPAPSGPVPWSSEATALDRAPRRGLVPYRAIAHLHSPWSHDACDGEPLPDGRPDPQCLQDLVDGLCAARIDAAFLTDHPAYAADQRWDDLLYCQDGDCDQGSVWDGAEVLWDGDVPRATRITCPSGHQVTWQVGIEGGVMPIGLHQHADDPQGTYDLEAPEAIGPLAEAGAVVLQAHTEQRSLDELQAFQAAGLSGTEIYNLHAAFDPDIRADYLGLDAYGYLTSMAPFVSDDDTAEPDLLYLGVLLRQDISLALWDTLLQDGPLVGTAGTDAHQNVLPALLRDGERGDSYRRMLRWFNNWILATDDSPDALQAALGQGRSAVVFEILGRPEGFDLSLEDAQGATYELGEQAPEGTLHVGCPTLAADSPQGDQAPEITVTVYKDGAPWQSGCGDYAAEGPAVYRVEVTIVPTHLTDFLGKDPSPWLHSYPWILSNPIYVSPGT